MSAITEMMGVGHEIEHNGKTYHVKLIDQEVKAQFESRWFARAKNAVKEMKELYSQDEYRAKLDKLADDYMAGKYQLVSTAGLEYSMTQSGMLLLCGLMFDCDTHELMSIFVEKQVEVAALLKQIFAESFPGVKVDEKENKETPKKKYQKRESAKRR